jgi:hypothetical protein
MLITFLGDNHLCLFFGYGSAWKWKFPSSIMFVLNLVDVPREGWVFAQSHLLVFLFCDKTKAWGRKNGVIGLWPHMEKAKIGHCECLLYSSPLWCLWMMATYGRLHVGRWQKFIVNKKTHMAMQTNTTNSRAWELTKSDKHTVWISSIYRDRFWQAVKL